MSVDTFDFTHATETTGPASIISPRSRVLSLTLSALPVGLFLYAAWMFYFHLTFWFDDTALSEVFSHILGQPMPPPPAPARGIAFALNFGLCPIAAVTAYSAWRLIEFYKRGDFFNPAAARWLCRATSLALAGNLYWNVVHPATVGLFAQGIDASWATVRWGEVWSVDELLKAVLFLALFGLARVQAAGVDLAREHAQIV